MSSYNKSNNKQSKEEVSKMKTEFANEIGVNLPEYNNYSDSQRSNARSKSNTKKNNKQNQNPNPNQ